MSNITAGRTALTHVLACHSKQTAEPTTSCLWRPDYASAPKRLRRSPRPRRCCLSRAPALLTVFPVVQQLAGGISGRQAQEDHDQSQQQGNLELRHGGCVPEIKVTPSERAGKCTAPTASLKYRLEVPYSSFRCNCMPVAAVLSSPRVQNARCP